MKKHWMVFAIALVMALGAAGALAQGYAYGDTADEVATIQEALTELDYYYADITGHYGRKTERAVTLFQRKYRLPQTGVADETTLAQLYLVTGHSVPEKAVGTLSTSLVLRRGSSGEAVRVLQENLTALGFYSGEITGNYGGLTQEAVRRFQRKNDLDSDGIAGRNTLGKLAVLMGDASGSAGAAASSGASSGAQEDGVTILRLNTRNDAVRKLQEDLTLLGYYSGEVTGKYGNLTKEAVRRFQRDNDLDSDGVAGPMTLAEVAKELTDEVGDEADGDAAANTAAGTTTPTESAATTTVQTPAAGTTVSLRDVTLLNTERVLRRTSSSGYVTRLQNALNALGYFPEKPTGYFGSATEEAVKAYQAAKGLTADGIAGRATLTAINKDLKEKLEGAVD